MLNHQNKLIHLAQVFRIKLDFLLNFLTVTLIYYIYFNFIQIQFN